MSVSKLYGMLQPGESETAAVRAVFFIDPSKKIRLIMYYPLNVGRNMDEIKRALEALQTADKYKCAMPLNWKKGEKVIVPPPKTMIELEERLASKYDMVDFYLAKKELVDVK
ncbi:MAG TPA: peroxiredoxin, partial [Saprospiraceae bacterium]|nr:peroxiredoxin [Saprospiraceae bacterium]